jgi:hypothetical protein
VNRTQIASMLEWIKRHDSFLVVDEITVIAWGDVLRPDIDPAWCKQYLIEYYSKADPQRVTAGRINEAWFRERDRNVVLHELEQPEATPMPGWFRDKLKNVGRF